MNINDIPNLDAVDEYIKKDESEIVSMSEAVKQMEAKMGGRDVYPIGFRAFDDVMTGGIGEGDLVVISGPSGQGKTTFAQTITWHLNKIGIPQLWFSYEVQITEIWQKFKAMGIDEDFMSFCPLKIESGNIDWIEKKITEGLLKYKTKVVFIDHLGFLNPKINEKNAKEFERNFSAYLGQLVRQLKSIAIEKNIIIILLAHTRKTKEELGMDDIAHSIGIAQESDFVFMIERQREKPKSSWDKSEGDVYTKYSKISLVKNRRTGINKFIKCVFSKGKLMEETDEIFI